LVDGNCQARGPDRRRPAYHLAGELELWGEATTLTPAYGETLEASGDVMQANVARSPVTEAHVPFQLDTVTRGENRV
jgi:hypothetical protein